MPLAVLLGRGPKELVALAGSEPALDPAHVCIMGVRDVDSLERDLVKEMGVRCYTMSELDERGTATCIKEALERLTADTAGVHLSFDLDGVDPEYAPGVGTAVPAGLDLRERISFARRSRRRGSSSRSTWSSSTPCSTPRTRQADSRCGSSSRRWERRSCSRAQYRSGHSPQ
jgi:arginase family enzyme